MAYAVALQVRTDRPATYSRYYDQICIDGPKMRVACIDHPLLQRLWATIFLHISKDGEADNAKQHFVNLLQTMVSQQLASCTDANIYVAAPSFQGHVRVCQSANYELFDSSLDECGIKAQYFSAADQDMEPSLFLSPLFGVFSALILIGCEF